MNRKRLLSILLIVSILLPQAYAIDSANTAVPTPAEVSQYYGEDGVVETQEIYSLPSDDSLPNYLKSIRYSDRFLDRDLSEEVELEEIIPENSVPEIPIQEPIPLSMIIEDGVLKVENISITENTEGSQSVRLEIRQDEIDSTLFYELTPFQSGQSIFIEDGVRYSIGLTIEYVEFIMGYYGYMTVSDGTVSFEDIWPIKTDKHEILSYSDTSDSESLDISLAAISSYEREPNNSYSQANTYIDDYDMYGTISSTSDVDWFKVSWDVDGKANFYLGNIPSTCNYDLKIYYRTKNSSSSPTLYRTLATSGSYEMVTGLAVSNELEYFMQVYSSKGFSTSAQYQLRAKLTSRDGDSWENNDTAANAKTLPVGSLASGTIHKRNDVDYYKLSISSCILTINLDNIPSTCNYNFELLSSGQTVLQSTSGQTGTSKSITVPLSSGTYYIRVYSSSGYNLTSNYRLSTKQRTQYTTVSGTINPHIKPTGGASVTATGIPSLPIRIVYTYGTSNTQSILTTTTTNASGNFSVSFTIPSNAKNVFVQLYPTDTKLGVQLLNGTIPTFLYEIPLNLSSVTLSITTWTEQARASLSIWRHAKNGAALYSNLSSRSSPAMLFRCTAGQYAGTAYYNNVTSKYISLNGSTTVPDYYNYDVILHEIGHWNMDANAGIPLHIVSGHDWYSPSTEILGYIEGWADYYSAVLRNSPYVRTYNSSGQFYGGNLSNCTVAPNFGSSFINLPTVSKYEDHLKFEARIGSSLWNLTGSQKTFSQIESLMIAGNSNFKGYYIRLINSLSTAADKEKAWNTCEKFGCAFDLTPPTVSLSISNLVANMSATDDIAVKQYEWYIDGYKYGSTRTGSTGSLSLSTLGLAPGTHTLECRAYDPEGIAPGVRPRTIRYGSASRSFVIAASPTAQTQTYDAVAPSIRQPLDERIMDSSMDIAVEIGEDRSLLELGTKKEYTITVNSGEELLVYADIAGALKAINVYGPDGTLYDSLAYVSPDAPYVVSAPQEGQWTIIMENYSAADLKNLVQGQRQTYSSAMSLEKLPVTNYDLVIGTTLRPVDLQALEIPDVTANSYILRDTLKDNPDIQIYEGDKKLDPNEPLPEGMHSLTLFRTSDTQKSQPVSLEIAVDQTAPTITFQELETVVNSDRVVLSIVCSDDTSEMRINGTQYNFGTCGSKTIVDFWLLDIGENHFTVEAKDAAGNVTTEHIVVTRS